MFLASSSYARRIWARSLAVTIVAVCLGGAAAPALADPPHWAPAHGYRAKHDHKHYRDDDKHRYGNRHKYRYRHDDDDDDDRDIVIIAPRTPYALPAGVDFGRCDRRLISRELLGGAVGGALGGLAGSQFGSGSGRQAAVVGGVLVGALVGTSIGRSMDLVDQVCVAQALELAPTNRPVVWRNPDFGADYQVVPTRTYQRSSGTYCREYQTTATIGGRVESMYGTACRQPDGSWKLGS